MIKDFQTYINEGLFDRNQSEFTIRKTDKGIEQVYIPKKKGELYSYIELDIEQAKKDGTYPNVNLKNIDVSELGDDGLKGLFGGNNIYKKIHTDIPDWNINPDISNWNIKYIPNNFFDSNEQIKEFTIPNGVTSIGESAFYNCSGLTSVIIPNSVTLINTDAFSGCKNLTSVTISNSVTSIGNSAFRGCRSLKSVTIPDSVESIGIYSFYGCSGLTYIDIPNGVTSIGESVFYGCSGLTYIDIPNGVTSIGEFAFCECSSLTLVTISKHCDIGTSSFPKNCKIIRR